VDLHRQVLTAPESAAHAGEVDPHLLGVETEARCDLVAIDVKPLGRHVDVDSALAVGDRDAGLGTEERLILLADLVDALDSDVRLGVGIAAADDERADDVRPRVVAIPVPHGRTVGMERLHLRRSFRIDDRLERLVLDAHRGGRATGLLGLLGRDNCDRLAVVPDPVAREDGLVVEFEPVGLRTGDVLVREHCVDARLTDRLRYVDPEDPRMRVRTPDRVPPQHPGRVEVARVLELAHDLGHGVGASRARRGPADLERPRRAHRRAAPRTASRIFA
jgi:hypothetical protein